MRVKVYTVVTVTGKENHHVKFGKLNLIYKTETGDELTVLKHNERATAVGGYAWQDNFETELNLPAGDNQLMVKTAQGENYEITLDVKIIK